MPRKIKENRLFAGFVKITGWPVAMLFYKPKIYYEDKKEQGKRMPAPGIFVSNHTNLLDFPLHLCTFWSRNIRFLVAEVQFTNGKLFSWFLYKLGAIKVDRVSRDFSFIGESLEALDSGRCIGIFPQGRIPLKDEGFIPYKPSLGYIASKTDAPIIPVYTDGNYGIFKRAHIIIGKRIYLSELDISGIDGSAAAEVITAAVEKKTVELSVMLEEKLKNEKDKRK